MEMLTHSVRIAAPGDGAAVGRLAEAATAHTDESIQGRARPGRDLLGHIETRGGVIRTRHGHTICRVAVDGQNRVIGMIHVCPPQSWIDDHPPSLRPALGRTVTELGLLAVDLGHQGHGVGKSLLDVVEEDERARGTELLFAKVARANWTSLRWYRNQGFTIAVPDEAFLIHTPHGESNIVDLKDGHALAYKPVQPGIRILRKRLPADVSFLYLSNLPADSEYGRLLIGAGSSVRRR
ncbi:GNAT family N-acetyltransferase [Streptomyces goshikiensis]|uniref:GNAT family N-acetyltransferase n=1 Tax=Streptomyces goshikiensis TaxID=1942 RepID=UPI002ADFA5BD|nr:GNAT family N-acetyltransferase [Streptomyces goshikiensis]